jgi:hypothetical protein
MAALYCMSSPRWLTKVPWPLRAVLLLPVRLYLLALELLIAWRLSHETNAYDLYGLRVAISPGPNQALYLDRLRIALGLLAERAPRALRNVQREIRGVVVLPHRISRGATYSHRSRVVILDQVVVWRWNLESVAVEIAGWAVEARLRRAGFGAERYRERREFRVLFTRITLGGTLLGMEESAAELLAQARKERAATILSRAAT